MSEELEAPQMFTIGALSRATGVPPDTLRTWERRYGFPKPERTDTGHRRYSQATLERLRLVREALQLGHCAANVIHADLASLRALVEEGRNSEAAESESRVNLRVIERWIELVRRFDGRGLERELCASLAALGVPSFLELRAAPFIQALGDRWADGLIGVRHEHFASERLSEFFIRQWRPLSDACSGPAVVCATPGGERHALGLQMAAFTLALNNVRVVYLGPDLPALEIAQAVTQHAACAVVLSAAAGTDHPRQADQLDRKRVNSHLSAAVKSASAELDARERFILEHRLLADPDVEYSLVHIGKLFGVSRERARQLEWRVKEKIKRHLAPLLATLEPSLA